MADYGTLRRHAWALPFEGIMAVSAAAMVMQRDTTLLLAAVFTCAVSFLPLFIERACRVRIPALVQTLFVAFIFLSMFSGEVLAMYMRVDYWDDIMHFISGLLVALGAVLCLVELEKRRHAALSHWLQTTFVFCLGASVAVLWEIVEFASDRFVGTFTQRGGLSDTMVDLIYGTLGALIVSFLFALHLQGKRVPALSRVIDLYVRKNQ